MATNMKGSWRISWTTNFTPTSILVPRGNRCQSFSTLAAHGSGYLANFVRIVGQIIISRASLQNLLILQSKRNKDMGDRLYRRMGHEGSNLPRGKWKGGPHELFGCLFVLRIWWLINWWDIGSQSKICQLGLEWHLTVCQVAHRIWCSGKTNFFIWP